GSRLRVDEACGHRLRALGRAATRGARHSHQCAVSGIHRHAHRRRRAARRPRRSADGSIVRRRCGPAGDAGCRDRARVDRAAEPRRPVPLPRHPGAALMARRRTWGEEAPPAPHIWRTLAYRGVEQGEGRAVIEWEATPDFCFHDGHGGFIVHGGLVTTLLDTAMGGACWSVLEEAESFLTADLQAEGRVVRRNRRVAFCAADLYDPGGELLASSRCTQIIRGT